MKGRRSKNISEEFQNVFHFSQEKAYWRVYKPPPGYNTLVENPPVPLRFVLEKQDK